jgi:ABC-2 type transport system ATP-binding protein
MILPMLQVNQLNKRYGNRHAVRSVTFGLKPGQTLGLIGPNGAGKSSTVSMVCGLMQPDSGEVLLNDKVMGLGRHPVKQLIGLVPQELALYEDLSAQENLKLFGALYGLRGQPLQRRCAEVLTLVNLADRAKDRVNTFSGGMKRRLNIASALLHDPQLIVLDEPTVGVDPQSRNAIFDCLEGLKREGRSLIYTSHYMEEVERLADHIVVMDHGQVLADASPAELYARLPATAALHLEFALLPSVDILRQLRTQPGVIELVAGNQNLDLTLHQPSDALPLLTWLEAQACTLTHFATARTKLEDVFLTLTGRSLRD